MEDRIRLLTEMEKEYEELFRAVKLVMQAADKKGRPAGRTCGGQPHDRRSNTPWPSRVAGGALQISWWIRRTCKSAIGYLKQRDGGRATFLPWTLSGRSCEESRIEEEYGFVGVASGWCSMKSATRRVPEPAGRTVVVEDLDCGAIARRYQGTASAS